MNMENLIKTLRRRSEEAEVVVYFLIFLSVTGLIANMAVEAFTNRGLLFNIINYITLVSGTNPVVFFILGIYLSLLALLWLDITKRWQATLLTIATITGFSTLSQLDFLLPTVEFRVISIFSLGIGTAVGFILGGGRNIFESRPRLHFRIADDLILAIISSIVLIIFLEAHLNYTSPILVVDSDIVLQPLRIQGFELNNFILHFVAVTIGLFSLRRSLTYEPVKEIAIVGPARSGKTTLLLGLFHVAFEIQDDWPANPSEDLFEVYTTFRQRGEWPPSTHTVYNYSFHYWRGKFFPKNINIKSLDYPGEILSEKLVYTISNPDSEVRTDKDKMVNEIAEEFRYADELVFLIDVASFVEDAPYIFKPGSISKEDDLTPPPEPEEYLKIYDKIIRELPNKEIQLVATKSDLLVEKFADVSGENKLHDSSSIEYEYFKDFINWDFFVEEIEPSFPTLKHLREESHSEIHPVFYRLEESKSSETGPRDPKQPIELVGFEELLENL